MHRGYRNNGHKLYIKDDYLASFIHAGHNSPRHPTLVQNHMAEKNQVKTWVAPGLRTNRKKKKLFVSPYFYALMDLTQPFINKRDLKQQIYKYINQSRNGEYLGPPSKSGFGPPNWFLQKDGTGSWRDRISLLIAEGSPLLKSSSDKEVPLGWICCLLGRRNLSGEEFLCWPS
ncbi:hypothetical protein TNCV_524191 [Trichonephila clavipes]|nr:hypothetical protein TNCV_524191 [Trichonephila clavipes]